jgi:hypothetical protein
MILLRHCFVKSWKTALALGKKEDALNISQILKTIMMRLRGCIS